MRFAQAYYVHGLWLILALAAFFVWAVHSRKSTMNTFARLALLHQMAS